VYRTYTDTEIQLGNERATHVDRVLDVRQGALCWIIGTVYMEMGLKPNILDDISKEVRCNPNLPLAMSTY
jgi:hypothetical protein